MKKICLSVMGLVAVVVLCAGCNDSGIADGNGEAEVFLNSLYGGATSGGGGGSSDYVELGGKKWMKKNLNIETEGSWCYDNDLQNCTKYGRLYTWEAAKAACQSIERRLPTKDEWEALVAEAGGAHYAGEKLKTRSGWKQNGNGTDDYGFSALPGGGRYYSGGSFLDVGEYGHWWTATEDGGSSDCIRLMYYDDGVGGGYTDKSSGLSVRCVEESNI